MASSGIEIMSTNVPSFPATGKRALAGVLLVATLGLIACERKPQAHEVPHPVVEVITLQGQDVAITRDWLGSLDGDVNASIRPQVTGYLLSQKYKEGDYVRKGQILFEIDPRTFLAAVDQAKAATERQRALHVTATETLARVRPLAARNAVSQKELDDAIGNELATKAAYDQAKAAQDAAELNLSFTRISSPIDGIAGIAQAQVGDLLSPSAPNALTMVSGVDPIKMYIDISEEEYLAISKKQLDAANLTLSLVLSDGTVYPHQGKYAVLNRQESATTGTFKVVALFPNPERLLRPGMFAKLTANVGTAKNAIVVPQRAIAEIQGKFLVATVDTANKVAIKMVTPGPRIGSSQVIQSGLQPGERVIVEGIQKVRDGVTVEPKPFVANASAASSVARKE